MAVHSEQAFPFNLFSSDCNDKLKDSLANTLQHSREEAQATYDRRTAVEKNRIAVSLAREAAQQA